MWFIGLFIFLVGLEIMYMLITGETTPFIRHGESYTVALEHRPLKFLLFLVGLAAFQLLLIRVLRQMKRDRDGARRRRRNDNL